MLIHDITPKTFADIYAQTIAYGMFAARLHDQTPEDFTRSEAANLIPKSNPFLRKVFQQIAGYDLDDRIAWIVDDLVSAFAATDMEHIMQGFGKSTQQTDPMLHFYEDFLFQYDPAAKKQCGVYYTPQPVVSFIVRAVDDILRTEFGLPMGLADTSKVEVEQAIPQDLKHRTEAKSKHRVQVLDPATGTGTFLAETVRQIKRDLGGQMGAWPSYVPEHLLPRLHGFELMMAPYTIAHLKLDMEIGIPSQERLKVYLTNSLEEYNEDAGTIFGNYLAQEANAASAIKRDAPVMIVLGNPPYSVSSNNKGQWISTLLEDYKKNLNERNIQPLSDDYIKFIRLAQHYVERNGEGVLAYICNNSFIDGLIHRQMRNELMRCFDKIYILDLHGNARKKEVCPDGSKDENVFDIMQGVSINIFVKTSKNNAPAEVRHLDLYGTREHKYEFLEQHNLCSIDWSILKPQEPQFFFVPKDFGSQVEYDKGFKIDELMGVGSTGIETRRDTITVKQSVNEIKEVLDDFITLSEEEIKNKYTDARDTRDWRVILAKEDLQKNNPIVLPISYRPFDIRYTIYTGKTRGFMGYPFDKIMRHLLNGKKNLALCTCKRQTSFDFQHIFVSETITERCLVSLQTGEVTNVFPLYLYTENIGQEERIVNFNKELYDKIAKGLNYLPSYDDNELIDPTSEYNGVLYPQDLFDYIYAVLHSPSYRERYKEFLKIDFPRIPYPTDWEKFRDLAMLGEELRELHLMHDIPSSPVQFNHAGSMLVEQISYADGCVRINSEQFFENVPQTAWEFYIGGYQPAQKWLKDRKGRTLSFDDIEHYRRIIAILMETDRLMKEIDK